MQGFEENEASRLVVQMESYLSDEEKRIKGDLVTSLRGIENSLRELKIKVDTFSTMQRDHFSRIKQNIKCRRDDLLQQVHAVSEYLLSEVNLTEEAFQAR